jgi:hypothetical protein
VDSDIEIVYMVPKHGGKDSKRVPVASSTSWSDLRDRLATIMGYDANEEFSISYCFSNTAKSVCNTLKDEDDYKGIIDYIQGHRRNAAPVQVLILDNVV